MLTVIIEYELKPGVEAAFQAALLAMLERVRTFDGYLGEEPCRSSLNPEKRVTISYWRDAEAIRAWYVDLEHQKIQKLGRDDWLAWYKVSVLKLERDYSHGPVPAAE